MKRSVLVLVLALMCAGMAVAEDTAWFDMENCAMCVNLVGVVEHVQWETHVVGNGMMSVTVVDPQHADAWASAHKEMEAVGQKLMAGEQLNMCNFCQSMGGIMMSGAKWENVKSDIANAEIMLMTSDKAEVVEMIQVHAKRTSEEYNKMLAAEGDSR